MGLGGSHAVLVPDKILPLIPGVFEAGNCRLGMSYDDFYHELFLRQKSPLVSLWQHNS
jgi:hypothetical protein